MHKQWIGCAAANFRKGRPAPYRPEAIVIHVISGSLQEAADRFHNPASSVSAHYGVGRDGTVHQFVEEADVAFHAGVVVSPCWELLKPGVNPNFYTIGVEHEGRPEDPWPAAQYDASAELIAELLARWNLPADEEHIVLHSEIRASKGCPGNVAVRDEILKRLREPRPVTPAQVTQVRLIANSNLRDEAPATTARILRVAPAGSVVDTVGFTDQGERIRGNAYWYSVSEGGYVWAGNTDAPHPRQEAPPAPGPLPAPAGAVKCGIESLDALFSDAAAAPLGPGGDSAAIGAVQDLLCGHGFNAVPGLLSRDYGTFGPKTMRALRDFRSRNGLGEAGSVDHDTLRKMVELPASAPRATRVYLTLALGFPFSGMHKILSLVSIMEGAGKFAALNLNTDRAGLSFGLIQWAQRPGRLVEIVEAFRRAEPAGFARIFGAGDGLIAHLRRTSGGVDPKTGETVDPAYNLVAEPWASRFREAALLPGLQQVQVRVAVEAFQKSYNRLRTFAPELASERAVAFMIDVANQFGDGGAKRLYQSMRRPGMEERDVLEAIAEESIREMPDRFQTGVRARRESFLETPFLSDGPFA